MGNGNIHGVALLIIPLVTVVALFKYGHRHPRHILIALVGGFIVALLSTMFFATKCGPSNNPHFQGYIPGLCASLSILFIDKNKVLFALLVLFLFSGFALSKHFNYLVIKTAEYTGNPNKVCKRNGYENYWHSTLTGLYQCRDENRVIAHRSACNMLSTERISNGLDTKP